MNSCSTNSIIKHSWLFRWAQYHTKHYGICNYDTSAKYYLKLFTFIISFIPHNNSIRLVLLFPHFLAEEMDFERLKTHAQTIQQSSEVNSVLFDSRIWALDNCLLTTQHNACLVVHCTNIATFYKPIKSYSEKEQTVWQ